MKRFQSIGVLLSAITGLLVVLLVSVFTYTAKQAYDRREGAVQLLKTVDVLKDVFTVQEKIRLQQGVMAAALVQPMPADAATRAEIERLHRESEAALQASHETALAELGGTIPNGPRIRRAKALYVKRYAEALESISQPLAARQAHIQDDWSNSVNDLVAAVNTRTRVRSMYIADASGYMGSVAIILTRQFGGMRLSWASFYAQTVVLLSTFGMLVTLVSAAYFRAKARRRVAVGVPTPA